MGSDTVGVGSSFSFGFLVTFPLCRPVFWWEGGALPPSPPVYAMEVESRRKGANFNVGGRSSALLRQMEPTAQDVCTAMGSNKLMEPDGVGRALRMLRNYFAPGAVDAVYQDAVRFPRFK